MKKQSIKVKMTVLYTLVVAVILAVILICGYFYLNQLELSKTEENIQEAVVGFVEQIDFSEGSYYIDSDAQFYNEGVMFVVYDGKGRLLHGSMPVEFPSTTNLVSRQTRTVENHGKHWMVYDEVYEYGKNQSVWIRGIESIQNVETFMSSVIMVLLLVFPITVIIVGIGSYQLLKRALQPVDDICSEAEEIRDGNNLSKRLSVPQKKDEMYQLSITFNAMFQRLEESFDREKQFTSDVSHELRTPIAVMISQCEYMLEQENLTSEDKREIQIILKQANKMSDLISQLLLIARSENGNLKLQYEAVDLRMLAEVVSEELEEKAKKKKIQIFFEGDNEVWMNGDHMLLMRLFLNLIDNAITYGKDGGSIRIFMKEEATRIHCFVEDDGIGISKEDQEKIWNRFYQVDKSRKTGMGLGLSMVQWIVAAHGGEIYVESEFDKGSRFEFTLRNS